MRRFQESERCPDRAIAIAALIVAALAAPVACSRRTLAPDDAGGTGHVGLDGGGAGADLAFDLTAADVGDGPNDPRLDVLFDTDDADANGTGLPCGGGLTCSGTDLCVTVNQCGGPMNCFDLPEGGLCPPDFTLNPNCPGGRPGCVPACLPPVYACVPKPAACPAAVTCACIDAPVCPFSTSCAFAGGRAVLCANQ